MKKIFTLLFAVIGFSASAQYVGVNTTSPKATLDIVGAPATAAATDGILVPKLTKTQLGAKTGYNATHSGTVVFVTDATGAATAATANVSQVGHYVFNGTIWTFLGLPTGAQTKVSNTVAEGVAVTFDNISVRVPSGAVNKSIQFSASTAFDITGSSQAIIGATKTTVSYPRETLAVNVWKYVDSSVNLNLDGAVHEFYFLNVNTKVSYRVTLIKGDATNNNITIEVLN